MELTPIEEHFISRAIQRNNLLLFHKCDMVEIINYCQEKKLNILGIDGFFLSIGGAIEPSMEHSIDFSSEFHLNMGRDNIYSVSMEFIEKQDESLVFEIITG